MNERPGFLFTFLYMRDCELAGVRVCVCVFRVCVGLAEVREMSCSVCVWLTLWSPPLIAGSMGCRQMPIFIGS